MEPFVSQFSHVPINYQESSLETYKNFLNQAASKNSKIILGKRSGTLDLYAYKSLADKISYIWNQVKGWLSECFGCRANRFNSIKIKKEVVEFLNYGVSKRFFEDAESLEQVSKLKSKLSKNKGNTRLIAKINDICKESNSQKNEKISEGVDQALQPKKYVLTIGDSTIDNIFWLLNKKGSNYEEAEKNCVEGQLNTMLNGQKKSYKVKSYAYDGFTTKSVLGVDKVGRVLGIQPSRPLNLKETAYLKNRGMQPQASSYEVRPLEQLKKFIMKQSDQEHYVVVSVGGNDFRELLSQPSKILAEIPAFQKRYLEILSQIRSLKGRVKPILLFQYRVDSGSDHYGIYQTLGNIAASTNAVANKSLNTYEQGVLFMGKLLETLYQPILEEAQKQGTPIIDLPNTFDPKQSDLYISQIEPSALGGALIAQGINHVIQNHDFASNKSVIYSKAGSSREYSGSENQGPAAWRVG